jgi:dihydropteroate synthase
VAALQDGADIIDVGGESARADVAVRDAEAEAHIVAIAVERIAAETGAVISVDTYKGRVASAAVAAGAHIINDIGGLKFDTGAGEVAAKTGAALVINYTSERPKVRPAQPPRYDEVLGAHIAFLSAQVAVAEKLGVRPEGIIVDPGIAFGKSHDEDLEVLRRLGELSRIGKPVLVAASRKHFIGSVTGAPPEGRDAATVAVTALSIAAGADFVRVHDVRANVQAARIADAIVRGHHGDFAPALHSWPWSASADVIPGTTIAREEPSSEP